MVRYSVILLFLILSFLLVTPSAIASYCRTWNGHQICLLSIDRSAKKYWEYRASVSVDGNKQPLMVYNCRQRTKVRPDGKILLFEKNDPGELVCRLYKKY